LDKANLLPLSFVRLQLVRVSQHSVFPYPGVWRRRLGRLGVVVSRQRRTGCPLSVAAYGYHSTRHW